jgi:hypothetical protein
MRLLRGGPSGEEGVRPAQPSGRSPFCQKYVKYDDHITL